MTTFGDQLYQYGGVPVGAKFTTGNVFFVDSVNGSDGNTGKRPSQAFATLDKATNSCTANHNDIVYILPNHAETISGATSWVPDVAGVQYIGIGLGADAPELTFSATGSSILIGGGNNLFQNIRFIAGISNVALACDVNAHHVTFDNCVWDYSTTGYDFIICIDATAYDYCTIQNCRFIAETSSTDSDRAIHFEDSNHLIIRNNLFTGMYTVAVISSTDSVASVSAFITDNEIYNSDTASANGGIRISNATTGVIAKNMIAWLNDDEGDNVIDPGSCIMFENYTATAIDTYGVATLHGLASS